MRIAIFSDVHADAPALRDALASIERIGCDRIVCAGDLVDYGMHPEETLDLLQEREIPCIRGNHDRWAVGASSLERSQEKLSGANLAFLQALPTAMDEVHERIRVAVRHASSNSDMRGIHPRFMPVAELRHHLEAAGADVLVVGHTHVPFRVEVEGAGVVVNPGALLREPNERLRDRPLLFDPDTRRFVPGPGPGGGTFGILELPSKTFTVFRAVDGTPISIPTGTFPAG